MFWHVIDFLKQKCILPDILLMSGILCMTVYLAFWHSIWQIFSDILFDIHLALRFYVSCSDLLFAVLLVILFDMHGMAFCLTLIGSSAGRLPKITDDFTGDPWLQIRGVSRMACVIRLGLYDMSQHSVIAGLWSYHGKGVVLHSDGTSFPGGQPKGGVVSSSLMVMSSWNHSCQLLHLHIP